MERDRNATYIIEELTTKEIGELESYIRDVLPKYLSTLDIYSNRLFQITEKLRPKHDEEGVSDNIKYVSEGLIGDFQHEMHRFSTILKMLDADIAKLEQLV